MRKEVFRVTKRLPQFIIRHSSFLEFSGFQLFTKKSNLLFDRTVLLDSLFDTFDGIKGGGMIAVKCFADALQGSIRIVACQVYGHLPGSDKILFTGP